MEFSFHCRQCDSTHTGIPSLGADAPYLFYEIPEYERAQRCELTSDACVIDSEHLFIRGCLEIPVHGLTEPFVWLVWVSLSKESFGEWLSHYETPQRAHFGPYFGWLNSALPLYPNTINLKTLAHVRNDGARPFIEVEPTEHPLALEQAHGINVERLEELITHALHN